MKKREPQPIVDGMPLTIIDREEKLEFKKAKLQTMEEIEYLEKELQDLYNMG